MDTEHGAVQQSPLPGPWPSFSLEQIDPVEMKCDEIRHLLKDPDSLTTDKTVTRYITRDTFLHSCRLYGQYFHRHYPVLHAPTFKVIETPPMLLLAVMIAGSCIRDGAIPSVHIPKLAMRLLVLIQNQPVCTPPPFPLATNLVDKS